MAQFNDFWMNFLEILNSQNCKLDIEFLSGCGDFESYPEVGMKTTVVGYSQPSDDGVFKLYVNYKRFDEYNRRFESSTYYDKHGVARLTAREAGYYSQEECLYCDCGVSYENYFKITDAPKAFQKYEIEKKMFNIDLTYIQWLEKKYEEKYER